ncbi:bifunctional DNA-formamidopyrimidine glycosylase/DNA-(apurinic or apyrimidinic site) lyase [Salinicoccus albus]|uniref:bifunctional DNA-formamidopyrimidine glycosylase/DNA-(apurinic or apyrimidinic site) lyase n=1 Tax=Salinicoccus albus TaxID=418756 RepID=UPI0003806843|nr:bifunctional DNA-formamidopyrimidine glycosylase/DNA-(apurinic or apyrimidinic site) lyase [Salinicoccus albus]
MPELPEVELVKRELAPRVQGRTIEGTDLSEFVNNGHRTGRKTIIKQDIETFKEWVTGASIIKVGRRGKYIYFVLEKNNDIFHLVAHLGMSGAIFAVDNMDDIDNVNFRKHWQVVFHLDDSTLMAYCDIRRFGEMSLAGRLNDFLPFSRMAPEYTDEGSAAYFLDRVKDQKNSNKMIKAVIMDSTVIPGVGNIYASEALYAAGILPTRKCANISAKRLAGLHQEIINVFELSLSKGGSTISDYRGVSGQSGNMQNGFSIYQKKKCGQCGSEVRTKVIATRNTFYCTTCQR